MEMSEFFKVGVLASGAGTNLQAIIDRTNGRKVRVVAVGSDRSEAMALERARHASIPTASFSKADFADREQRDVAIAKWLKENDVQLVVLAGYMQIVTKAFLDYFPNAVINIHPALLPAFPGMYAVHQAVEYGVKIYGITIHFVDEGVDTGPIILQRAVEIPDLQTPDQVHDRLQVVEHELLPQVIDLISTGAISIDPKNPRRVLVKNPERL